MADTLRIFEPGAPVTFKASAAVTGGRNVEVSGVGTVAHAAAAGSTKIVGQAAHDALIGQDVVVLTRGSGVHRSAAAAEIAAGVLVKDSGTSGVAAWVSGTDGQHLIVGLTLSGSSAAGDPIDYLAL